MWNRQDPDQPGLRVHTRARTQFHRTGNVPALSRRKMGERGTFDAPRRSGVRHRRRPERLFPGPHTWNGTYTELRMSWRDHTFLLQTTHEGDDLLMLATPLTSKSAVSPAVVFSADRKSTRLNSSHLGISY